MLTSEQLAELDKELIGVQMNQLANSDEQTAHLYESFKNHPYFALPERKFTFANADASKTRIISARSLAEAKEIVAKNPAIKTWKLME